MPMMNKSFHCLSSTPINELVEESSLKQGIVTILASDCEKTKVSSLRRTLSADMSSKKWLEQNGFFSPVKKTASSEELVVSVESSSSSEDEEGNEKSRGQDAVWASVLSQKGQNEIKKPGLMDVWDSILVQKSEECLILSPPYVHPLVKISSTGLSEQSLEMCTECIGSETGSEGFCSEIVSDVGQGEMKELNSVRDLYTSNSRKSVASPFPPPLSFISGGDGASVHMRSHRKNGRLVLEAVSVPSRKCFQACRSNGRLSLTFIDSHTPQVSTKDIADIEVVGVDEVCDDMEEAFDQETEGTVGGEDNGCGKVEEEELVEDENVQINNDGNVVQFIADQNSISLPRMISVHKSGLMMKRIIGFGNRTMNLEVAVVMEELQITKSLPPPPRGVPRSTPSPPIPPTTLNAYEYFWRNKGSVGDGFTGSMVTTSQSIPLKTNNCWKAKGTNNQDLVLRRGNKTEYFGPYLNGCKEFTRSLRIREPCSIATS